MSLRLIFPSRIKNAAESLEGVKLKAVLGLMVHYSEAVDVNHDAAPQYSRPLSRESLGNCFVGVSFFSIYPHVALFINFVKVIFFTHSIAELPLMIRFFFCSTFNLPRLF